MNLIEQLGGYEKAKEKRDDISHTLDNGELLGGGDAREGLYERLESIDKALFEYRRQHNIFEVGDLVTYKAHFKGMWREGFGKITEIDEDLEIVNIDENVGVAISEIEHANDEEIKAGKRLEVNDGST